MDRNAPDVLAARALMGRAQQKLDRVSKPALVTACKLFGRHVPGRKPALLAQLVAHFEQLDAAIPPNGPCAEAEGSQAVPTQIAPPKVPALCKAAPQAEAVAAPDWLWDIASLRAANVTGMKANVWASRHNQDIYTRSAVLPDIPHVDHIVEIQVVNRAMRRVASGHVGLLTRAGLKSLRQEIVDAAGLRINGMLNLNVTSDTFNHAKMGPFRAFSHRVDRLDSGDAVAVWSAGDACLGGYARGHSAKWLVDDGTWARVERAVGDTIDTIADELGPLGGLPAKYGQELSQLMSLMGLEPRSR